MQQVDIASLRTSKKYPITSNGSRTLRLIPQEQKGVVELELFNLTFEEPIDHFEGGVTNLGDVIAERSGVWTFEAKSASGSEIELGLHKSAHLGNSEFSYLCAADAEGIIELPKLNFVPAAASLTIRYFPIFTKSPLDKTQIGPLVYFTNIYGDNTKVQTVNFAWRAEELSTEPKRHSL